MNYYMNVNDLYPRVHDISEVEVPHQHTVPSSSCCSDAFLDTQGCFSLEHLVVPGLSSTPPPSRTRESTNARGVVRSRADLSQVDDNRPLTFHDVYVLTRQIHRGNSCTVWECVDRATGHRFAVKMIDRRNLSSRDDEEVNFEVSMLRQVSSDSIGTVRLVAFYEESKAYYIVTEFADGGDLLTRILRGSALSEGDARMLARSLVLGTQHLHEQMGICHRNLRAENILLHGKGFGDVAIADFGQATRILMDCDGDILPLTERCIVSSYTAPEILKRHAYDTQSDMWSLGVVLFYALSGRLPFEGDTKRDIYQRIVKSDYAFDPVVWKGVSKEAKRFVANLLHPDPTVRMTAEEALDHAWIADLKPVHIVQELPEQQSKSQFNTKKKLKEVWKKAFRSKKKGKFFKREDDGSTSSQTQSIMSTSDVPSTNGSSSGFK